MPRWPSSSIGSCGSDSRTLPVQTVRSPDSPSIRSSVRKDPHRHSCDRKATSISWNDDATRRALAALGTWPGALSRSRDRSRVGLEFAARQIDAKAPFNQVANGAVIAKSANRPSALTSDLEDASPTHSLRGTRARRQRTSKEGAGAQDDPRNSEVSA